MGAIKHENMKKKVFQQVNIIFRTLSRPPNINPDTSLYTIYIPLVAQQKYRHEIRVDEPLPRTKQESFLLQGDQFFYLDKRTIVVNPIVLGYRNDIRMVLDSRDAERPRMAIKVLPKP